MIPAPLLQSTDPASALGEPDPDGIYRIDETDSVLTLARSLYAADRLPVYGSIFANLQTAGRGQYGRAWESARGNLHAGVRLPLEGVYAARASAAATAALTAEALRSLGFPVLMKCLTTSSVFRPMGRPKWAAFCSKKLTGSSPQGSASMSTGRPKCRRSERALHSRPGAWCPRGSRNGSL